MLYAYLRNWLKAQEGQDMIEYALIVVLLVAVAAVGMNLLGANISALWTAITAWLNPAPTLPPIT